MFMMENIHANWDKDKIEFRVLFTNDISVFTNENLYVNSRFKNPADRHQHSID